MEFVSNLWVGTGVAAAALGFNSPQALVHHARSMPATAARREGRTWRINMPEFAAELRRRRLALLPLRFEVRPAPDAVAGSASIAFDAVTFHVMWRWERGTLVLRVPAAFGPGATRPAFEMAPEVEARVRERITAAVPPRLPPPDRRSRRRAVDAPARGAQP